MTREYELVLMLDPDAPEDRRVEIAGGARKLIESGATMKRADHWGMRNLVYEIRHRSEADYHFFRFEGGKDVLDQLDHTLKIADGVLRFRIFRTDPAAPAEAPPAVHATLPRSTRARRSEEPPPGEEGSEPEAAAEAEPAGAAASAETPGPEGSADEDADQPAEAPAPEAEPAEVIAPEAEGELAEGEPAADDEQPPEAGGEQQPEADDAQQS